MTKKQVLKLVDEFNQCKTLKEQVQFLQGKRIFILYLDNDCQFISIDIKLIQDLSEDEEDDFSEMIYDKLNVIKLSRYFGNSDGVFKLFEILDIRAEGV